MSSSWFAGATPKLATAVMYNRGVGNEDLEGYLVPFFGGTYPAMTFKAYMDAAIDPADCGSSPAGQHQERPGRASYDAGAEARQTKSDGSELRRQRQRVRVGRPASNERRRRAAPAVTSTDGGGTDDGGGELIRRRRRARDGGGDGNNGDGAGRRDA